MRLNTKAVIASTALVAASLMPGFAREGVAHTATTSAAQVVVPLELSEAAEFVTLLQRAGVVVQEVKLGSSKFFEESEQAVFILTNLGMLEVEIFKIEKGAESITVTYGKNSDSAMAHSYEISRPKGNKVGWTASSTPLFFTMHDKWFIKTWSARLDVLIKEALGEANALSR
jgi:hypothetical protein